MGDRLKMNMKIFNFSGTGNTLRIAERIAKNLGGRTIPIASLEEKDIIHTQSEMIGIVFPVYYADLPMIVKRFAEKLDDINNKYIFGVATYGGDFGTSFKTLSKIIENRNGCLSGKYGIHASECI